MQPLIWLLAAVRLAQHLPHAKRTASPFTAAAAHQTGNMDLLWVDWQQWRAPSSRQATVGLLCQIQVAFVNTGALTYCHCPQNVQNLRRSVTQWNPRVSAKAWH